MKKIGFMLVAVTMLCIISAGSVSAFSLQEKTMHITMKANGVTYTPNDGDIYFFPESTPIYITLTVDDLPQNLHLQFSDWHVTTNTTINHTVSTGKEFSINGNGNSTETNYMLPPRSHQLQFTYAGSNGYNVLWLSQKKIWIIITD